MINYSYKRRVEQCIHLCGSNPEVSILNDNNGGMVTEMVLAGKLPCSNIFNRISLKNISAILLAGYYLLFLFNTLRWKTAYIHFRSECSIQQKVRYIMLNSNNVPPTEIELAWREYVSTGKTDNLAVKPSILASWARCRQQAIDPGDGSSHKVLDQFQLEKLVHENERYLNIAKPMITNLYNFINDTQYAVLLTDAQGYILTSVCNFQIIEYLTKINYGPGARWREEDVGTNAIGLALITGKPSQTTGAEHYCITHHVATCSAAPIYKPDQSLLGVVVITAPIGEAHKHTLGMALAVAEAISEQLKVKAVNYWLSGILMNMADGVVILDKTGRVCEMNPVAERILSVLVKDAVGCKYLNLIDDKTSYVRDVLAYGIPFSEKEIVINNNKTPTLYSANPIRDEQGSIIGGVILINPVEKMQRIIKRYASSSTRIQFEDIIGNSEEFQNAIKVARRAAENSSNILLEGESGSGKDMFAQAIHNQSSRRNKPFVAINCGAIPRELIASELFGYSGGAFTGAKKEGKPGKFEIADGGTVFLDEISEMPLEQQVNLLRVIQDKQVPRIGGEIEIPVDVRIICATNKNLQDEIKKGSFRQDLYYRLNVISIQIPPLRNRKQDIPILFYYFLHQGKNLCEIDQVAPDVIEYLKNYDWPGNVRELQNVVERMLNLAEESYLSIENLPPEISSLSLRVTEDISSQPVKDIINDVRQQIQKTRIDEEQKEFLSLLQQCEGNVSRMARVLGVNRSTIYRKMRRYNVHKGN